MMQKSNRGSTPQDAKHYLYGLEEFSNLEADDQGVEYDEEQCDAQESSDDGECAAEGEGLLQLADDELKNTGITSLTDAQVQDGPKEIQYKYN